MRDKISYWDGTILAAAHRLSAPILSNEDLNHGQTCGSVRVVTSSLPVWAPERTACRS